MDLVLKITDLAKAILSFGGVVLIVVGILHLNRRFAEWNIRFSNSLRGLKSHITKESLAAQKAIGIMLIIMGVGLIMMGLFVIPLLA